MQQPIDLPEAIRLRTAVAKLVVDDPAYSPIFERLDDMVTTLQKRQSALQRAERIVRRQLDIATFI